MSAQKLLYWIHTKKVLSKSKGFTLLEILLVVAAISILAGIVILAINPTKQLADTRNAQRRIDVNTVLNAIYQYAIDNNGALPTGISTGAIEICKTGAACTGLLDLSVLTTNQKYVVLMPFDPSAATAAGTAYFASKSANGRVTVNAPGAENAAGFEVG